VTYFLLVVQMTTSSRDSAAADIVTTVPTAEMYYNKSLHIE